MAEHGISDAELETIRAVLAECDDEITQVDLFGSRATGKHRSHSDIDLVIHGTVREAAIDRLRTLFIESNLPVSVDIFNYDGITCLPLKEHVDTVRQRLFTAQDIQGSGDRSMRDRRGSAIVEFMTANLKTYPNMKDSGVEALGQVPVHWAIRRLAQIGTISKGGGGNKDDEVSAGIPCIRYGDLYTTHNSFIEKSRSFVSKEKARKYTAIKYGDVLFAGSGETIDEIGKSAVNLMRQDACCGGDVILFRPTQQIEARYLGYALDCRQAATQKATMGRGITIIHIYGTQMKYLTIPIPPLDEQSAIVRFLDNADRHIQRYIRARQKLIALLAEQKQAIIHQVVTGQIDVRTGRSFPVYKPSGVDWIGSVPEKWVISSLRHRYVQCLGKMLDSNRITTDHLLPYLRNVDVQWDRINIEKLPKMDITPAEYDRYTVKRGDLLVCEGGEIGRCALWSNELSRCGFQKALHRLRPRDMRQDMPRFMYYTLRSAAHSHAFTDGHVSTIPHLTGDKLKAHRFPFPPLSEQKKIVRFLDSVTEAIDAATHRFRRQVTLLHDYRKLLIDDVVTGKIDVRSEGRSATLVLD